MVYERTKEFHEDPRSGPQRRASLSTDLQKRRSEETRRYHEFEGSVKKKPGFFRRHPVLTALGVGAAAYFLFPAGLARAWAGMERSLASVPLNRIRQTIHSARPLTGRIGAAPGGEAPREVGA